MLLHKNHLKQLYLKEKFSLAKAKYENQPKVVKKFVRKNMRQYYQLKTNKKDGQNTRNFSDALKEIMGESKNLEIKEVESNLEIKEVESPSQTLGKNLQKNLLLNAMRPTQKNCQQSISQKKSNNGDKQTFE